jgi:hypothetical protein
MASERPQVGQQTPEAVYSGAVGSLFAGHFLTHRSEGCAGAARLVPCLTPASWSHRRITASASAHVPLHVISWRAQQHIDRSGFQIHALHAAKGSRSTVDRLATLVRHTDGRSCLSNGGETSVDSGSPVMKLARPTVQLASGSRR